MTDLSCKVAGITAPHPFRLASAPPTDKLYNEVSARLHRRKEIAVDKTLGFPSERQHANCDIAHAKHRRQTISSIKALDTVYRLRGPAPTHNGIADGGQ